jgi:hypothetical protein
MCRPQLLTEQVKLTLNKTRWAVNYSDVTLTVSFVLHVRHLPVYEEVNIREPPQAGS